MDNRAQIEEIKSKLDIASVIQQYVPSLKHSGRNYFGLCPFHKEKTPSFSVNPELGLFKCFGCGQGGDVIKFLELIESLDFPKALELAANRAGVVLKRDYSPQELKYKEEKDKLLAVNKLTAQFYHYVLMKHGTGEHGRAYAKKRQLEEKQLVDFQIGFAPKSFDNLRNMLNKKGFADKDLVRWGLLVEKNGRIYDKFRNRLIFPIHNHQGDVVGFSCRKISEDDLGPKYLNSPETIVYKKSHLLYGLYQAKDAIRENGFVIMVEGNLDLVSSHRAGVKNIVAPNGTALTEDQLKLLKRYCEKVYFSFDMDAAGQKALVKSFELAEKVGIESYVCEIHGFKDIDEMICAGGDWAKTVSERVETVAYLINKLAEKYDLSNTKFKAKYVKEILGYVAMVGNKVAQADYLKKIAEKTDIREEVLMNELAQVGVVKTPVVEELPGMPQIQVQQGNRKLTLEDFIVEFIALIINHKNMPKDEAYIDKVLGMGPAYLILQQLISGKENPELSKYKRIIDNIKMRPIEQITSEREFAHVMDNLGLRIMHEKAQQQIRKLRKTIGGEDAEVIKKINEAAKLLK